MELNRNHHHAIIDVRRCQSSACGTRKMIRRRCREDTNSCFRSTPSAQMLWCYECVLHCLSAMHKRRILDACMFPLCVVLCCVSCRFPCRDLCFFLSFSCRFPV